MPKEIDKYPILKEYGIFETGGYYIELHKPIETEGELEQFIRLSDEIFSKSKLKNGKRK